MILELEGVEAGYGLLQVLWGISLEVQSEGEVVALVGPNGAGKT
ncbi:MAG: ABC transporter ATP-binding protein, partial [Clostridia bacterium]|nr:ABC transporter ATP-binding protein [Clostridia bacterium]